MEIKIDKNKQMYAGLLVAGTLLLTILLSLLVVKPIYQANKKVSEEIKLKKSKLDGLENKLGKLKELKKEEALLLKEKERVLAALPEDKDVPRLFVQFEKMATSTGASVASAAGGQELSSAGSAAQVPSNISPNILKEHTYDLKVTTSTYESLKNIVGNAEDALRLVDIHNFSISKKESSFDVSFNLKTFSRSEALK